ncbi:MAG TPA: hypothetical protein ENI59_01335 [Euryarchaeota archaeon]|nr:hypothetical protein [Euryarchaeota archaeon]
MVPHDIPYSMIIIATLLIGAFISGAFAKMRKSLGIITGIIVLSLSFGFSIASAIDVFTNGVRIELAGGWLPPTGINFYVGPFSAVVVSIGLFLALISFIFQYKEISPEKAPAYLPLFILFVAGFSGMLYTGDVFNFFVFMEILSISGMVLIASLESKHSSFAAFKYYVIASLSSSMFLVGVAIIYSSTGILNMAFLSESIKGVNSDYIKFASVLIILALAAEAEMLPLGLWVPDAYERAPSFISAILASLMGISGVYGILRFVNVVFPGVEGIRYVTTTIVIIMALLTVFVTELVAAIQNRAKRMIAYAGMAQLSIIAMVGILGTEASSAASFHIINIMLVEFLLFMTTQYFTGMGDALGKNNFSVAILLSIGALAAIGMPPFGPFWSKLYMVISAYTAGCPLISIAIILGSVAEVYFFARVLYHVWKSGIKIASCPEKRVAVLMLVALLIVLIGIYPKIVISTVLPKMGSDLAGVSYLDNVLSVVGWSL